LLDVAKQQCARCGGDVSYGASYAPDSSLLCAECTTTLKAAATEIRADLERQAKKRKARSLRGSAVALVGVLTSMGVVGIVLSILVAGLVTRLNGCVDTVIRTGLDLLGAAGRTN